MFLWYIYKTLWLTAAMLSISISASGDDLKMFFLGLFCCFMYNIFSALEHLPEEKQSS